MYLERAEGVHIPAVHCAAGRVSHLHHLLRARDQGQDLRGRRQCLHVGKNKPGRGRSVTCRVQSCSRVATLSIDCKTRRWHQT